LKAVDFVDTKSHLGKTDASMTNLQKTQGLVCVRNKRDCSLVVGRMWCWLRRQCVFILGSDNLLLLYFSYHCRNLQPIKWWQVSLPTVKILSRWKWRSIYWCSRGWRYFSISCMCTF